MFSNLMKKNIFILKAKSSSLTFSNSFKGVPAVCAISWGIVKIVISEQEGLHAAAHQVSG